MTCLRKIKFLCQSKRKNRNVDNNKTSTLRKLIPDSGPITIKLFEKSTEKLPPILATVALTKWIS